MHLLPNQNMSAKLDPVAQYAVLAEFCTNNPELSAILLETAEKLVAAAAQGLTGRVQVNFQTGIAKSVTIKGQ